MTTKNEKAKTEVAKASKQLFKPAFGILVDGNNPDDGSTMPCINRVAANKLQAK